MAARSQPRRSLASSVAAVEMHGGPDDPRLPDLRRRLALAAVEEKIAAAVADAPPLPPDLTTRLQQLIRSASVDRTEARAA